MTNEQIVLRDFLTRIGKHFLEHADPLTEDRLRGILNVSKEWLVGNLNTIEGMGLVTHYKGLWGMNPEQLRRIAVWLEVEDRLSK